MPAELADEYAAELSAFIERMLHGEMCRAEYLNRVTALVIAFNRALGIVSTARAPQ